jgi:hypothetical protein
MAAYRRPPNCDYFHFTGRAKPWLADPPMELNKWQSAQHFWFYHLSQLNEELQMGLNFQNWTKGRRPSLVRSTFYLFYTELPSEHALTSRLSSGYERHVLYHLQRFNKLAGGLLGVLFLSRYCEVDIVLCETKCHLLNSVKKVC